MKKRHLKVAVIAAFATLLPLLSLAQDTGTSNSLYSLQGVLENLYSQMMPMCSSLIGVAQGIAGFAALWYIGARVWKHLAAAEPIDVYPLLRPFAIGCCIAIFPSVLALMNGIMQPVVTATQGMVTTSSQAINNMLTPNPQTPDKEDNTLLPDNSNPDKYYQYSHPDNSTTTATNSSPISDAFSGWGVKNMIKKTIAELLNILFEAAALCIDTIRTFKLIVLAILGPLCFGLSVFDGFQHTLKQWIARYVNVFMWLPVANIFGAIIAKIQENMIQLQQSGGAANPSFGDTNTLYLIFMVIGIVGYFSVPGIANYIMNVGGHALFSKTSALASMAVSYLGGSVMQSFSKGNTAQTNQQSNQQNNNNRAGDSQNFSKSKLSGSPPKNN
ncbi:conjugative transposon protein TraJ [Mucilaginibacter sp. E4BP6]|uniref:conjugative transposon protein TraJ n=1 Tax=Mucilaginibacter sp. E4BP6 TaxID=2723089 RepID=UPI0015C776E6|nr:conjugative transposon protein TraJ [Mucilaginibacter sp. E4BP6]NYE68001.1 conjugative transposon TraJ protein [Mucilaginibacter sp. E4BP6]